MLNLIKKHLNLRTLNIFALYGLGAVVSYRVLAFFFVSATAQVQIVWTVMGLVGFVISAFNLKDSLNDLRALDNIGKNGDLRVMAKVGIRVDALRLSKMAAIVTIGLVALQSSPVLTDAQRKALHIPEWTFTGVLLTGLLFYIVLVTVVQAFLDREIRIRFYERDENTSHHH